MSETEGERLARVEVQLEQLREQVRELGDTVKELRSALDKIKGGSLVIYALMAASATVGGLVVRLLPSLKG